MCGPPKSTCECARRFIEATETYARDWLARVGALPIAEGGFSFEPSAALLPEFVTTCQPLCDEGARLLARHLHQRIPVVYHPPSHPDPEHQCTEAPPSEAGDGDNYSSCEPPEIEITPEMIEAGEDAFGRVGNQDLHDADETVVTIFRAMWRAMVPHARASAFREPFRAR